MEASQWVYDRSCPDHSSDRQAKVVGWVLRTTARIPFAEWGFPNSHGRPLPISFCPRSILRVRKPSGMVWQVCGRCTWGNHQILGCPLFARAEVPCTSNPLDSAHSSPMGRVYLGDLSSLALTQLWLHSAQMVLVWVGGCIPLFPPSEPPIVQRELDEGCIVNVDAHPPTVWLSHAGCGQLSPSLHL